MRRTYQSLLPSAAVMLPNAAMHRGTVPFSAVRPRANLIKRAGQTSLGLPANWAWGTDVNGNPIPMTGPNATDTPIALPPGATQWGRVRPSSDQTGSGPSTPVPLDANGYAVVPTSTPSTGIMVGLTALGLIVGYAFATSSGGVRMNPIRRHFSRFRHSLRSAHRF